MYRFSDTLIEDVPAMLTTAPSSFKENIIPIPESSLSDKIILKAIHTFSNIMLNLYRSIARDAAAVGYRHVVERPRQALPVRVRYPSRSSFVGSVANTVFSFISYLATYSLPTVHYIPIPIPPAPAQARAILFLVNHYLAATVMGHAVSYTLDY